MTDIEIKEREEEIDNTNTTTTTSESSTNQDTIIMNPTTTTTAISKIGGYEFFRTVLKSPKLVVAPMVDHTYLAFRMLTRKYGADLVYTPMFHSKNFVTCKTYRKENFTTCPEDRPLVVQFCGNDPEWVVKAAKLVEDHCDAVDLNLGCPQQIARRGNYGSFLLDKPHIILPIVRELHKNIKVPIFCKIRLLPDLKDTIKLALDLQEAGCQLLTVHGRTKEQKGQYAGHANWDAIRQIKEVLSIPVIANGSVVKFDHIDKCLEVSKADGIMSAEGLLANPSFFCGKDIPIYQVAHEYMDMAIKYPTEGHIVRSHLFKMLKEKFDNYSDLRDKMGLTHTIDGFRDIVNELENRYKTNAPFIKCLTNKQKRELKEKEDQENQEKKQKLEENNNNNDNTINLNNNNNNNNNNMDNNNMDNNNIDNNSNNNNNNNDNNNNNIENNNNTNVTEEK